MIACFRRPDDLIIDDNPTNLAVVGELLSRQGWIIVGLSGELGLELARNDQPDLIVLDVLLPGINGFETCRRLKPMSAPMLFR